MTTRRKTFWLLLILFAAGVLGWLLYVPCRPERVYAAIPGGASFVTAHRGVAGRWDDFSRNPLTRSLLNSMGIAPAMVDDLSTNAEFRAWLSKLAADEVVVAYVPSWGAAGEGAWILTSWIGGRSQYLRWMLSWRKEGVFKELGRLGGRVVWAVDPELLPDLPPVTLVLDEGVLIVCISEHAAAMRRALDTLDSRSARRGSPEWEAVVAHACGDRTSADRGWIRWGERGGEWAYSFSRLLADSAEGQFCTGTRATGETGGTAGPGMDGLDRVLGSLPLAVAAVSTDVFRGGMPPARRAFWAASCMESLDRLGVEAVVAAVLGGEYQGRLKGIRWPGIVLCCRAPDPAVALAEAGALLDRLNARYRWGLIPREVQAGNQRVWVVESTADTIYSTLAFDERLAYATCGEWFLLAGNAGTLRRLVERYDDAASAAGSAGGWQRAWPSDASKGFGWVDLARGGKVLRVALTAYALKLAAEDPSRTRRVRQRLNEAKAWIDGLAPLGESRLILALDPGGLSVQFSMGGASDGDGEAAQPAAASNSGGGL